MISSVKFQGQIPMFYTQELAEIQPWMQTGTDTYLLQ